MKQKQNPEEIIRQVYDKNNPDYCLFDNMMMNEAFKGNIALIRHVLQVITRKDYEIQNVQTQERIPPKGKGTFIVLDICAKDKDGRLFDIEFQNQMDDPQILLRLKRYFSTMTYADRQEQLKEWHKGNDGERFEEKGHTKCIIFLVNHGRKDPDLDRFDQSELTGEKKREGVIHYFPYMKGDEFYIIHMKEVRKETDLGSLIHDLLCSKTKEIHNNEIADVLDFYQNRMGNDMSSTKKERDFHKKVKEEVYAIAHDIGVEEGREEGKEQGRKEGREEGRKEGREEGIKEGREEGIKEGEEKGRKEGEEKTKAETAKNLIKLGVDDDTIMKAFGLSKEEIDGLRKETI